MLHPDQYPPNPNSINLPTKAPKSENNRIDLAGTFSPGHALLPLSGSYPDIGSGTMPLGSPSIQIPNPDNRDDVESRQVKHDGQLSPADLRRMSIESSVLKKKNLQQPGSESGESISNRAGGEPLVEAEEALEGLGFADENGESITIPSIETAKRNNQADSGEGSTSSSSHPTSPSPQLRQVLITPATAEVFHRNGMHTPDSPAPPLNTNGIKVIIDGDQGNLYFREDQEISDGSAGEFKGDKKISVEPVFASLAHTPEQLREIARMRENAAKAERGRKRMIQAVVVPPLTPSPSKSPVPKRE